MYIAASHSCDLYRAPFLKSGMCYPFMRGLLFLQFMSIFATKLEPTCIFILASALCQCLGCLARSRYADLIYQNICQQLNLTAGKLFHDHVS
jgi:hypothetical protein